MPLGGLAGSKQVGTQLCGPRTPPPWSAETPASPVPSGLRADLHSGELAKPTDGASWGCGSRGARPPLLDPAQARGSQREGKPLLQLGSSGEQRPPRSEPRLSGHHRPLSGLAGLRALEQAPRTPASPARLLGAGGHGGGAGVWGARGGTRGVWGTRGTRGGHGGVWGAQGRTLSGSCCLDLRPEADWGWAGER